MESSFTSDPPRDRIQEAERISTSQGGVCKEAGGLVTHSSGMAAHSSGMAAQSSGMAAHSSGMATQSSGMATHSSGMTAHSSGTVTHSSGMVAHSSGMVAHSSGMATHSPGMATHSTLPAEGFRPQEKKKVQAHPSSRPSAVPSSHQKSCQSLDKFIPSSSIGSLDLQPSSSSRSGSIAGMTVPIRLDALSYLLNNALMGTYKMPPPLPFYGGQCVPSACQPCPYSQMGGSPYTMCMSQQHASAPCSNQSCQPSYTMCVNQPCFQACQPQAPNFMQCGGIPAVGPNRSPYPVFASQNVLTQNSTSTAVPFGNAANSQQDRNSWPRKPSDGFAMSTSNQLPSDNDSNKFSAQSSFGKFEDNQNKESWPTKQQSDFTRGRGRADFAIRTWQSNTRGQDRERRFGDRSRNSDTFSRNESFFKSSDSFSRNNDAFSEKRGFGSPERSQGRGQYSKRGRWSGGGRGGGRDTWQQRNQQNETPMWSDVSATRSRSNSGAGLTFQQQSGKSDAGDEDWENDYPGDAAPKEKADEPSSKCEISPSPSHAFPSDYGAFKCKESPQNPSLTEDDLDKSVTEQVHNSDENPKETDCIKSPRGYASDPDCSKEDGNKYPVPENINGKEDVAVKVPLPVPEDINGGEDVAVKVPLLDPENINGGEDVAVKIPLLVPENINGGEDVAVKVPLEETDPISVLLPAEETSLLQLVGSDRDAGGQDIYMLEISVENEENKGIVFELVEATNGLADP